jgi:hypothetical protein
MEFINTCIDENMNILAAHNAIRFDPAHLLKQDLKVQENSIINIDDEINSVEIEYKWLGNNNIKITHYFEGRLFFMISFIKIITLN